MGGASKLEILIRYRSVQSGLLASLPLEAQQAKELAKIVQDADPFRYSVDDAGYIVAARPPRIIHLGMILLAQNIDRVIQIIELPVQS